MSFTAHAVHYPVQYSNKVRPQVEGLPVQKRYSSNAIRQLETQQWDIADVSAHDRLASPSHAPVAQAVSLASRHGCTSKFRTTF